MDDKVYKITLGNGHIVDQLRMNGNNFISATEIDKSVFSGNLSKVTINDGVRDEVHKNMDLIHLTKMGDSEYWFALRDLSDREITQKAFMSAASMIATKTLSDEEALTVAAIFPEWSADSVNYKKDDCVRYGDTLYKCLQNHVSQVSWTPETAVSLWVRTDDPAVEWPEWIQPTGAHDAYPKGAKVTHNGKKWVSDVESNVWEPGTPSSNWTEYTEK